MSVDDYQALRYGLAQTMYEWGNRVLSWEGVCKHDEEERDSFLAYADAVLAELLNHKLAVLNLIGDVAEGAIRVYGDTGHWDVIPVAHAPEARPHVFVVRVRGDATDG